MKNFRNGYQVLSLFELIDNTALTVSGHGKNKISLSAIDISHAYIEIPLSKKTSNQRNFSIVGVDVTGSSRFKAGFYGLGDMPNKFQRMKICLIKKLPTTHSYLDDILFASIGSAKRSMQTYSRCFPEPQTTKG